MYPDDKVIIPTAVTDEIIPKGDHNSLKTLIEAMEDAFGYGANFMRIAGHYMFSADDTYDIGEPTKGARFIYCASRVISGAVDGGNTSLQLQQDSITVIMITPTKRVGINEDDPDTQLHVNGGTKLEGDVEITGDTTLKVYSQAGEPTLDADNKMAIWKDTDDSNRIYLLFRRGVADQVKVELV